jgi:integrase
MVEISPLRRRMIEDMTVRNLSPATQRSYLHAVSKFSRFFGRSPDTLTREDVRTFQVHLASKGVAWASLNQTVTALRFLYGLTLGLAEVPERVAFAREPRRLPVVLSADEVVRFLEALPSLSAYVWLLHARLKISCEGSAFQARTRDDEEKGSFPVPANRAAMQHITYQSSSLKDISCVLPYSSCG